MNNLRNRGVEDILITVVNGLKDFSTLSTLPSLRPQSKAALSIWYVIHSTPAAGRIAKPSQKA